MTPSCFAPLSVLTSALEAGECTSAELTAAYLERIRATEPTVGAFLTVDADNALRAAAESDRRRREGKPLSPLDGIPFAVKDNFCTAGLRTTCASKMLEHYVPPYDATAVARLRLAGGILLGKLNMDEFGMGSSTEYSALGITRNPLDSTRVPGGSSGGAAAAVASGEVPFALGSDTGGSVRQPAAFCGTVGIKPTYGAISRYGLVAFASSLDCIGILARTAADGASVLAYLIGADEKDMTAQKHPNADFQTGIGNGVKGMKVAVCRELTGDVLSPTVRDATVEAVAALESLGATVTTVSLPSPRTALASYYVLSAAEASSNLARFDGVRFGRRTEAASDLFTLYADSRAQGFGAEVRRRILFGTYVLSADTREAYYKRAVRTRAYIRSEMMKILSSHDLILTPTAPTEAFRRGEVPTPELMYRSDLCTVYASLAGLPAVSVPFGQGRLPAGIQLIARPFDEKNLLRAASALEKCGGRMS